MVRECHRGNSFGRKHYFSWGPDSLLSAERSLGSWCVYACAHRCMCGGVCVCVWVCTGVCVHGYVVCMGVCVYVYMCVQHNTYNPIRRPWRYIWNKTNSFLTSRSPKAQGFCPTEVSKKQSGPANRVGSRHSFPACRRALPLPTAPHTEWKLSGEKNSAQLCERPHRFPASASGRSVSSFPRGAAV